MIPFPKKASVSVLAFLLLSAGLAAPAAAQAVLVPDACTHSLTAGPLTVAPLAGGEIRVFSTPGAVRGKRVVLMINGNGFSSANYDPLATHLASNGFITAVFARAGNIASLPAVFDAIDDVLAHLGIAVNDPDLDLALVGHSVGGRLVLDAAQENSTGLLGYPIKVVATLAPVASTTAFIDGWDISAYLSIYGSQDEDVDAYDGTVNEAFFAYDRAGTENSTTCNTPPCVATSPAFQKTMVFAYGADHAGVIGLAFSGNVVDPQNLDYLSAADSLCITKAYLTGFLRWHLWGDAIYKGMLRGEWKPISVGLIDTAEADGFGNPAGSPLRLFFQNSPVQHKSIQVFTGGLGSFTKTTGLVFEAEVAGDWAASPFSIRHDGHLAFVGWDGSSGNQWLRLAVPAGSRDGSNFSHFSLRLGQLNGVPAPHDNPVNANQSVWVGLEDVNGAISWHNLTGIPAPDRYTAGGPIRAQSHLSTRRIATTAITGINLSDVRAVRLFFSSGTHGTLMIDNLEWHRD